ncbi:cell division transport system permease protein [Dichotomicrobium thermohalophilum]|uniref:Cell division transport system permease protein n=2 Tax=Dichotomicrobium thermohalophilum TaxID=933063 RepID=A0A397PP38_9HYPH|nr:cell division transport system permease protein [Dichotomicrobium thermohalophilum]
MRNLPAVIREQPLAVPKLALRNSPIVPPRSVTGRSLVVVITIMAFLASLTTGVVYLINQSASAWLRDVASEVTVQVRPAADATQTEAKLAEISDFLSKQIGIADVRVLSQRETNALIEPWLGKVEGLESLPLPRLIAVQLDRENPPDLPTLSVALEGEFEGAMLDDHGRWQAQIRSLTSTLAVAGLGVIALVALATVAIIVSATRSAMASNREIVEVLHFVGARDRFIAQQFEKHFQTLGIMAGAAGAGLAALVFVVFPLLPSLFGASPATDAELRRLVGAGTLDWLGYALLVLVVVVVAAICRITSRFGVYRILDQQNR